MTNKEIVQQMICAVWNRRDAAAIDQFFAPDFHDHNPDLGVPPSRAGLKCSTAAFLSRFPDLHVTIENLIAEGDTVVARLILYGDQQAAPRGASEGRRVVATAISILRFRADQIVERWSVYESSEIIR
jgi:predicted ester cyclase